uniref:BET bromodomain protein n=1 Tax=Marseillevirus LCMAC101 TaxID=2506602 RepID=A0A481YS13_9VIRU|nr:MAG: BET bromodomain protein [Marseillevirus LCMAC101]
MGTKGNNYGLYQTLNQNISKKDLKSVQKTYILEKITTLSSRETEAVVMLVCEHARIQEDFVYDPEDITLPYGGSFDKKTVTFDLKKMPISLRWIILRFLEIVKK